MTRRAHPKVKSAGPYWLVVACCGVSLPEQPTQSCPEQILVKARQNLPISALHVRLRSAGWQVLGGKGPHGTVLTPACPRCVLKMIDWFQAQPVEDAGAAAELDRLRAVVTAVLAQQEKDAQEG